MKLLIVALIGAIFGVNLILAGPVTISTSSLLGAKQCTWGPSFWCSNITNAKSCNAVSHCIQTVWVNHNLYPEDNDSICKICLDMVKQARDQLMSNETQDDIKAVFEGSCNLIPIKIVRKECDKLADDFIPELIEALASQMDPNVVCSVAGLCNNAAIDKMLADMPPQGVQIEDLSDGTYTEDRRLTCTNCNDVGKMMEERFLSKNRDEILDTMVDTCGKLSSLSDGCANIVITYFNEIYNHMKDNFKAENICHMSGVCSGKFHKHEESEESDEIKPEIRPMSEVGVIQGAGGDDIPCELCEQLMKHLRDLLVANTTEAEFKMVLEGLCNQTKSFRGECTSIVDQYYDVIYSTLVNNLDANGACFMIGICKKGDALSEKIITGRPKKLLGEGEPTFTNEEIMGFQLPIDVLMGAPNKDLLVENGEKCTMCEFFLHFVQDTLSSPTNEEEIKQAVNSVCEKMPKHIAPQCHNFVMTYGDAFIALLVQEIAPATICPRLRLCPGQMVDAEVFSPIPLEVNADMSSGQPKCPLCMFAVTEAIERIRSNKTKTSVIHTLDTLCDHLVPKMKPECRDFVETYSSELLDLLASDFTPQQICVYLRLCKNNVEKHDYQGIDIEAQVLGQPREQMLGKFSVPIQESNEDNEIFTNEIPDETVNGEFVDGGALEYEENPECKICEEIIKEVERRVVNKKARDQVEHALHLACDRLGKFKAKCSRYVDKYEDTIIDGVMKGLAPKRICSQIQLCIPRDTERDLDVDEAFIVSMVATPSKQQQPQSSVSDSPGCVLCEFVMQNLEKEIKDKKTEAEIKQAVLSVCTIMPKTVEPKCQDFINQYADLIIQLIASTPPKEICSKMMLCMEHQIELIANSGAEVVECGVCQGAVTAVDKILSDKQIDQDIENVFEKACDKLPAKYIKRCTEFLEIYGQSVINIIKAGTPEKVCTEVGMCFKNENSGMIQFDDSELEIMV